MRVTPLFCPISQTYLMVTYPLNKSKQRISLAYAHFKFKFYPYTYTYTAWQFSLVPRPHPLAGRNGLVNKVKFLGLYYWNVVRTNERNLTLFIPARGCGLGTFLPIRVRGCGLGTFSSHKGVLSGYDTDGS